MIFEAIPCHFSSIEDVASINDKMTFHATFNLVPIRQTKLLPLGEQQQGLCAVKGIVHVVAIGHSIANPTLALVHGDGIVGPDLTTSLLEQIYHDEGRCLTHVVGLGLEGQAPKGYGLASQRLVSENTLKLTEQDALLTFVHALNSL